MFNLEENSGISITRLDIERLKDMNVNDRVDGECGFWVVFRNRDSYLLTIDTEREHKILDFTSLSEVIGYLKES